MACRITWRITTPAGDREELPGSDILDQIEEEEAGEQEEPEQWIEVDRTTEEIDVGGVLVDRIIRVTFEKPTGKQVELVFAEAQD